MDFFKQKLKKEHYSKNIDANYRGHEYNFGELSEVLIKMLSTDYSPGDGARDTELVEFTQMLSNLSTDNEDLKTRANTIKTNIMGMAERVSKKNKDIAQYDKILKAREQETDIPVIMKKLAALKKKKNVEAKEISDQYAEIEKIRDRLRKSASNTQYKEAYEAKKKIEDDAINDVTSSINDILTEFEEHCFKDCANLPAKERNKLVALVANAMVKDMEGPQNSEVKLLRVIIATMVIVTLISLVALITYKIAIDRVDIDKLLVANPKLADALLKSKVMLDNITPTVQGAKDIMKTIKENAGMTAAGIASVVGFISYYGKISDWIGKMMPKSVSGFCKYLFNVTTTITPKVEMSVMVKVEQMNLFDHIYKEYNSNDKRLVVKYINKDSNDIVKLHVDDQTNIASFEDKKTYADSVLKDFDNRLDAFSKAGYGGSDAKMNLLKELNALKDANKNSPDWIFNKQFRTLVDSFNIMDRDIEFKKSRHHTHVNAVINNVALDGAGKDI